MRYALIAALAATLCHVSTAAADDRPAYDPAIEAAAIAILQKKLPEIRASQDLVAKPVIVRGARPADEPQGISALIDLGALQNLQGRIIWL